MHRDELHIPEPCHADWNGMEPREKSRFCSACSIEVIDVSAYAERDARELAARPRPARVCMSYVVRADGTIRFADSPAQARVDDPNAPNAPDVPLRALTRRGRSMVAAATLALAACQPMSDASQALFGAELPMLAERRTAGEPVAIPEPPPPTTAPDAGTRATLESPPAKPDVTDAPVVPCQAEAGLGGLIPEQRLSGGVSARNR